MTPPTTAPTGEALLGVALEVARAAVEVVREHASRGVGVGVAATKSSEVDVVTEADRASEALIRSLLRERRPDDAVLGEEGEDRAGTSGVRWVVDPIDGTVNFLYGIPQYAVSVAAEVTSADGDDGAEVVAGVVVNAATGVEYAAHVGADGRATATRDGVPISVAGPTPLGQRLVATGFSYDSDLRALQAHALVRFLPRVRDVRRLGSCALDLCHVAEGLVDGYVEEGVHLWDHAAGGLVARAAGARTRLMTGVGGRDLLVAAPAHGFDELLEAVLDAGFAAG
ncbi:inositol monophosphatase family protein [Nocardioides deserti]|uniref:Inositol-1-monophosphatase n=1 Tax=Nocardioides deserti TaxID=1588644 RepID=A0ABR6U3F4_9ACTN|nr:inositol monophosphatase family protein [Nocardioides deserti]MBC2958918.1 inositol monophosphatase [Nocardioides deserti]GGO69254.1 fructose-1,6-bisphosphatase [Nocardioides deserti]